MAFNFPFWMFPIVSATTWFGMLLAMLIVWITEGSPHYDSMSDNQRIAFISDIGAQGLKPLFVTGCVVTSVFLDLSLVSERWLRHRGLLARNTGKWQKVLSILSIVSAIIGTIGLILLSVFDALRHPSLHRVFLAFFIVGFILSAIFICWQFQRLGIHFREHRILRQSFWVKLVFIIIEIVLALIYGVLLRTKNTNPGAVFEWVVALIFTFYILGFIFDLAPASRGKSTPTQSTELDSDLAERPV